MNINDLSLTRDVRIKKVLAPTKARMFDKCKKDDILHFSIKIKSVGSSTRGSHAARIKALNTRTGEETDFSFNQAYFYKDLFELEEV